MTVEVLGTVLGTAIQGQIVGQADTPCLERASDSTPVNRTNITTSPKETVSSCLAGSGGGAVVTAYGVIDRQAGTQLTEQRGNQVKRGRRICPGTESEWVGETTGALRICSQSQHWVVATSLILLPFPKERW